MVVTNKWMSCRAQREVWLPLPSRHDEITISIYRPLSTTAPHRSTLTSTFPHPAPSILSPPLPSHPTSPLPSQSIRKPKPRRPIAHLPDLLFTHPLHPAVLVASPPPRIDPHEIQRHAAVQHGRVADHGQRDGVAFDVAGARGRWVQLTITGRTVRVCRGEGRTEQGIGDSQMAP